MKVAGEHVRQGDHVWEEKRRLKPRGSSTHQGALKTSDEQGKIQWGRGKYSDHGKGEVEQRTGGGEGKKSGQQSRKRLGD